MLAERIAKLIAPTIEALGFELVRVQLSGSQRPTLQVMAEPVSRRAMSVDDCADISRAISALLDVEDPIAGTYSLEVSSPGIDRPLTRASDYATWAGHEVNVSLDEPVADHRKLRGELLGIESETVAIADRKAGRIEVPLAQIRSARLVLTDKLIAATRPLDTSGVEELEDLEEEKAED
jgi:ribosome maturation factor RimP